MHRAISINFSVGDSLFRRNRRRRDRPKRNSASGSLGGRLKEPKRRARVCRETRASCRRCIPYARGRAIKRMQIKTFYLNDNITLVDASALAQVSIINIMQISAPPPSPLSVPATFRHYTTLNSKSMYACICIYAYTQVYSPPLPFLAVLHRHTAHHPRARRGRLVLPYYTTYETFIH